ncbi:MAG: polyphosphate polymerase domain-containing protein [Bacteriovoracaceae bacterium]|jgi:SPX domain protein involved in polyphosphate accumulation|nr:polyphosphate polymerase domain-containing protein [Bacteriovoracaceae bacterium]
MMPPTVLRVLSSEKLETPNIAPDQSIGNSTGEFRRIEDKHLVDAPLLGEVLTVISQYMDASYLDDDTDYTLIESLYFDSDNLDFFRHHFMGLDTRYKIRARRYAPNGKWSEGPVLLELKRKKDGECKKSRFMLPKKDFEALLEGKTLNFTKEICELNESMESGALLRRVNKINELILKYELKPSVRVRYHRNAFERDGFRATVDSNIEVKILKDVDTELAAELKGLDIWTKAEKVLRKYQHGKKFVLELKHQGTIPAWANDLLLNELGIKKTGFSKYCWGLANEVKEKARLQ